MQRFFFEVIFWTPGATYGGPSAIYVYEYAVRYLVIHCRSLAPDGLRTEQIPPQPGTSKYRFPAAVIPSCIPLHLSRLLAFRDRSARSWYRVLPILVKPKGRLRRRRRSGLSYKYSKRKP